MNLIGSTVTGNTANYYAGGLYVQNSVFNCKNTHFSDNVVEFYDGAVMVQDSRVSYDGCTFENNTPMNSTARGM